MCLERFYFLIITSCNYLAGSDSSSAKWQGNWLLGYPSYNVWQGLNGLPESADCTIPSFSPFHICVLFFSFQELKNIVKHKEMDRWVGGWMDRMVEGLKEDGWVDG